MEWQGVIKMDKRIKVCVNGIEYEVNAIFSLNDYKVAYYIKEENPDYRSVLTKIIKNHFVLEPEKSEIEYLEMEEIQKYIDTVVQNSKNIKEKYEKHSDINDVCKRFLIAVNENTENEVQKISETIKNAPAIDIPQIVLPEIPKIQMPEKQFDYTAIFPGMKVVFEAMTEISRKIMDIQGIGNIVAKGLNAIIESQQVYIRQMTDHVSKMLSQISIPPFSEEDLEEIRRTLRTWGEYGWTLPPHAKPSDFFTTPENKKNADKIGDSYCKQGQMDALFTETRKISGVKLSDYEEAVANYNEKRYKSCALILFSLIDAKLIRMQRTDDRNGRGRRPSGKSAAINVYNRIKNETELEEELFVFFRLENIYACMKKVFQDGDDFKKQPDVINRNFLNHGMLTRRVRRRDCVQLFLLYFNWMMFLEKYVDE